MKFTHESSKESLPFLDLKVELSKGKISTDLYVKDTDRHQYLHYTSSHPNHAKRPIVCSQTLRIKRICSEEKDFEQHIHQMKSWFQKRVYPNKVLDEEPVKVRICNQEKTCSKKGIGTLFVVMYHPILQAVNDIIKRNINWLYADNEVKNVFSPGPMISFRCARKLSSYLFRAKVYLLERKT